MSFDVWVITSSSKTSLDIAAAIEQAFAGIKAVPISKEVHFIRQQQSAAPRLVVTDGKCRSRDGSTKDLETFENFEDRIKEYCDQHEVPILWFEPYTWSDETLQGVKAFLES